MHPIQPPFAVDRADEPAPRQRPSGHAAPRKLLLLACILLAGCAVDVPSGSPSGTASTPASSDALATPRPTLTGPSTPTASPAPSPLATPSPVPTPAPTATPPPAPTPTATQRSEPVSTPTPPGSAWHGAREPAVPRGHPAGWIESAAPWGKGFVAVGRGCRYEGRQFCEAIVWTTANARRWTRTPAQRPLDLGFAIPLSGPEVGMFDVAAGRPGLVAVGYTARDGMQATAWFSRDGVTWKRRWIGSPNVSRVRAVAWTGTRFVIVGEDRSDLRDWRDLGTAKVRAAVWTSRDGLTWTRVRHTRSLRAGGFVDTSEDPITGGMRDVVAGPDGLVAVGSVCRSATGTCSAAAWASADGRRWSRVAGMPAVGGVLESVARARDGSGYVATGRRSCGKRAPIELPSCTALVATSPDGVTWTRRVFPQGSDMRTVTWVGDRYVGTTPDGPVLVWTSRRGAAWVRADVEGGPAVVAGDTVVQWHFAATARRAVWVGTPAQRSAPRAWFSVGGSR